MALNSELDDLLSAVGGGDDSGPAASASASSSAKQSGSVGGSPLNKWKVKTRGLMKKARLARGLSPNSGDSDESGSPRRGRKQDVKNILGTGFSFRKLAGWTSPSRTNKNDLRQVVEIIEEVINGSANEMSTEAIMQAVSKEMGQLFNPSTWAEWFNIKIEDIYDKREDEKEERRGAGLMQSTGNKVALRSGRARRQDFDDDDDDSTDTDGSDEDTPIRSSRSRGSGSPNNGLGRQTPRSSSSRREIIDDESDSDDAELASAPYSEFRIGSFCTVLPAADATSVSREVRKLRKIKTQIWGPMQQKYGDQTGRIIGRNEHEELIKLQFPQADLWFAFEALDLTDDPTVIRAATDALRKANAQTPPQAKKKGINFQSAAANLAQKSMERVKEEDEDSDDDLRQHFHDTTEQVEEVTVTFAAGALGMGFGWDGEYLEVFKFNRDADGNKGQAELSESIMVGDLLVAVNERPLTGLTKAEVISILKTTPRPMDCTFRGIPAQ